MLNNEQLDILVQYCLNPVFPCDKWAGPGRARSPMHMKRKWYGKQTLWRVTACTLIWLTRFWLQSKRRKKKKKKKRRKNRRHSQTQEKWLHISKKNRFYFFPPISRHPHGQVKGMFTYGVRSHTRAASQHAPYTFWHVHILRTYVPGCVGLIFFKKNIISSLSLSSFLLLRESKPTSGPVNAKLGYADFWDLDNPGHPS